jgi:nucleoside-diphosphate-sugar epimerase
MLVEMGARLGDVHARLTGHATLLTSEKVALNRATHWVCSSERAQRELGFTPAVSLETGIAETYQWYVSRGCLKAAS